MLPGKCRVAAFVTVAAAISLTGSPAQEPESSLGSRLPPNVRALLIQEMNAILQASHAILEAVVRGQHEVVAEQATLIHDSFILEQQMTQADRMALEETAPPSFIEKDEGVVFESADNLTKAFVEAMKGHRVWEREKPRKVPA